MQDVGYDGQHQMNVPAQDGGDGDQLERGHEAQRPAVHGRGGVRGRRLGGPWRRWSRCCGGGGGGAGVPRWSSRAEWRGTAASPRRTVVPGHVQVAARGRGHGRSQLSAAEDEEIARGQLHCVTYCSIGRHAPTPWCRYTRVQGQRKRKPDAADRRLLLAARKMLNDLYMTDACERG